MKKRICKDVFEAAVQRLVRTVPQTERMIDRKAVATDEDQTSLKDALSKEVVQILLSCSSSSSPSSSVFQSAPNSPLEAIRVREEARREWDRLPSLVQTIVSERSASPANDDLFSLTDAQMALFEQHLEQRSKGRPLCHIVRDPNRSASWIGFWKNDFLAGPEALIPRPETEMLVQISLDRLNSKMKDHLKDDATINIAEFGLGTGCVLFSVLLDLLDQFPSLPTPKLHGLGIDISVSALRLAQRNLIFHPQLEPYVSLLRSSDQLSLTLSFFFSSSLRSDR